MVKVRVTTALELQPKFRNVCPAFHGSITLIAVVLGLELESPKNEMRKKKKVYGNYLRPEILQRPEQKCLCYMTATPHIRYVYMHFPTSVRHYAPAASCKSSIVNNSCRIPKINRDRYIQKQQILCMGCLPAKLLCQWFSLLGGFG